MLDMLKIRNVQVKDTEKATCLELSAMSYLSKFLYGCLTQQLVVTSLMVIITLKGRWLLLSLSHEWKKKKKMEAQKGLVTLPKVIQQARQFTTCLPPASLAGSRAGTTSTKTTRLA